jgi:hypothetical protein
MCALLVVSAWQILYKRSISLEKYQEQITVITSSGTTRDVSTLDAGFAAVFVH